MKRRGILFFDLFFLLIFLGCGNSVDQPREREIEPLGHPKAENAIVYLISATGWKGRTRAEMRGFLDEHRREFELIAVSCLGEKGIKCEARFDNPLTSEEKTAFENWLNEKGISWEASVGEGTMPTHVKFEHMLCGLVYYPHPDKVEDPRRPVSDPIQVNKLDSHWYVYEEDWN